MKKRKKRLKFKHLVGLFKWAVTLIPAYITKLFIKNLWLVEEDDNEARDNGYWLYRYIKLYHPEQKCFFVLNKKSPDFKKVDYLGKTIQPNSFSHWFWYLVASKNISSQTGGKPCPAFLNLMEQKGIFKTKTYFLQHGVIMNDLKWLYYNKVKLKLFTVSATEEYEHVTSKYGHPKGVVQLLGLTRFDNLHQDITDDDMILVMPTWRNYINNTSAIIDTAEGVEAQNFLESEYYNGWNNFLNSKELDEFLTKNNKYIYFYPHRNMQPFVKHFKTESKNIIIATQAKNDVQTLLRQCKLIITDFSSVLFDVLYQNKPVICYQFDEKTFRKGQYSEGYLNYKKTPLLKQTETLQGVINLLEEYNKNGYKINKKTENAIKKFFPIRDNKNCERTYNFIKNN